jgi:hypothetical protein
LQTNHANFEIYHAQHEHAATKNIVEDIETALAKAGVHSRLDRPPAMCFLDITGFTRLTEERRDEAAGPSSRSGCPGWFSGLRSSTEARPSSVWATE